MNINQSQLKSILAVHLHIMLMDVSFAPRLAPKKSSIKLRLAVSLMANIFDNYPCNNFYEQNCNKFLSVMLPISEKLLKNIPRSSLILYEDFFTSVIKNFSKHSIIDTNEVNVFLGHKYDSLGLFDYHCKYFSLYVLKDLAKSFNNDELIEKTLLPVSQIASKQKIKASHSYFFEARANVIVGTDDADPSLGDDEDIKENIPPNINR